VEERSLKMTEVSRKVEEGDGDRNPVCKYYGKYIRGRGSAQT